MRTPQWIVSAVAMVLVVAVGTGGAVAATPRPAAPGAVQYRLNPPRNIKPPQAVFGPACINHGKGKRCTRIMVRALNRARGVMNQPRYHLPAGFASMLPRDQLLVLTNADRTLYGLTRVRGISPRLNRSADFGARQERDPSFVLLVNGVRLRAGASNWAGGTPPMSSVLYAYYEWMYDDGFGSANVDCRHRGAAGCWGHRDNTLLHTGPGLQIEMGVGFAKPGMYSWSDLLEAFSASATIPCLPTVTGLSRHTGPTSGSTLVVHGYGFVQVRAVTVLGAKARITKRGRWALTIKAPRHRAGSGFVRVITASGKSTKANAAYRYAA